MVRRAARRRAAGRASLMSGGILPGELLVATGNCGGTARELRGRGLWGALPHGCEALWTGGTLFSGGLDRPDRVEFMSHPLPTLHGSRRRWRRVGDD